MTTVGKTVGRYQILEQIGSGGMAVVYKAYDLRLDRHVALKVVLPQFQQTVEFQQRFQREAQSLARLTHPNIVGVIDFGEQDGLHYLVMEYVPGGSLKQHRSGPMPVGEAARLVIPVARALASAHKAGIVHRDVKPANILLTSTGETMLSDFGIATILDAEKAAGLTVSGPTADGQPGTDLTGAGLSMGSPEYMSPEQATGEPVDGRGDIYSLGIVLYELVTGRTPFKADTPFAVLMKQANDPPPTPGQFIADLPREVERVLLKALAKQPSERFQTMEEFAQALEHAAASGAGPGWPPSDNRADHLPGFIPAPVQGDTGRVQVLPEQPEEKAGSHELWKRVRLPLGILGALGMLFLVAVLVIFVIWRPFGPAGGGLEPGPQNTAAPGEPTGLAAVDLEQPSPITAVSATAELLASPTQETLETAAPEASLTPAGPTVLLNPADGAQVDLVAAGEFLMGSEPNIDPYFWGAEFPRRTVLLDYDYTIYHTEVTNAMYALCVQAGACLSPPRTDSMTRQVYYGDAAFDNYPVIHVPWQSAQDYCQWAGGRLPSEAEWEKAARGTDGRLFPWGNEAADATRVNYCDRNCPGDRRYEDDDQYADTAPVGSFVTNASPYGALDMSGNVLEWVNDWFQPFYYESAPGTNPTGPDSGLNDQRVARGGSFFQDIAAMRSVGRTPRNPSNGQDTIGFRCMLESLP